LYVQPSARRQGVGRALLADAAGWAVETGCAGLDGTALPGDRVAKSFFEAVGMRARMLVMHRALAPNPPIG
ncbi:MAG TPA: GNAT family N-acetyltransferase, partial [Acidimicrobiales bacterium]|nr:GNAT family N-acetyltransferase [Acidimicrobiales bacterium]